MAFTIIMTVLSHNRIYCITLFNRSFNAHWKDVKGWGLQGSHNRGVSRLVGNFLDEHERHAKTCQTCPEEDIVVVDQGQHQEDQPVNLPPVEHLSPSQRWNEYIFSSANIYLGQLCEM